MHESLRDLSSRFKLEAYFENSIDLLAVIGQDGCFRALNPYWEEFLGYPLDEMIGQHFTRFVHPEDAESTRSYGREVIETGAARRDFRNRYIRKDGEVRWLEWAVTFADGSCFTIARDITKQLRTMDEMTTQQYLLQAFFEHGNLAVSVVDQDLRYLLVSRRWCEDFDFKCSDQVIGRTFAELFPGQPEDAQARFADLIRSGKPSSGESVTRLRNGHEEWMRWQIHPWLSPSSLPGGAIIFSEFTTDRKEAEVAAITQSRLSSLGEITASIAHEINNPLTIIQGTASQLSRRLAAGTVPEAEVRQQLGRIEQTSVRISKIVKGLRSFARDGRHDPITEVRFTDLLENTLAFCKSRIQQLQIELLVDIVPTDLTIECRETEISQVLVNLLNNAAEAIAGLPERWIRITATRDDHSVHVRVTDSGRGILPAIEALIMRPFFTTKEAGAGMGLGLSISRRLVRSHGGDLNYSLSPDGHTRFSFHIPRSE